MTNKSQDFGKEDIKNINKSSIEFIASCNNPILMTIEFVYMNPNKKQNTNFIPISSNQVAVYMNSKWNSMSRSSFLKKLLARAKDILIMENVVIPRSDQENITAIDEFLMYFMPYFDSVLDRKHIARVFENNKSKS